MSEENNTKHNKDIEDELQRTESSIRHLIELQYPHLSIMVSIQVLHSSQRKYRPPACNVKCKIIQLDNTLRKRCDDSDIAMKHYVDRKIRNGGDKKITVGYRCHQNLSNIIIPIAWHQYYWYIFLGQFLLRGCGKSFNNPECTAGFKSENIEILSATEIEREIETEYKECVRSGLFYKANDVKDASGICFLEIPELLVCKVLATIRFKRFLDDISKNQEKKDMYESWLKTYGQQSIKSPETMYRQYEERK